MSTQIWKQITIRIIPLWKHLEGGVFMLLVLFYISLFYQKLFKNISVPNPKSHSQNYNHCCHTLLQTISFNSVKRILIYILYIIKGLWAENQRYGVASGTTGRALRDGSFWGVGFNPLCKSKIFFVLETLACINPSVLWTAPLCFA